MNVSIILCTRNRPDLIEPCVTSILNNTYVNLELLIIDQSTDNETRDKVNNYWPNDKRIHYQAMKAKGKSKALNFGIKKSSGDILVLTDDDCVVDHDWIEKIVAAFQEHPVIGLIVGSVVDSRTVINGEEGRSESLIKEGQFSGRLAKRFIIGDGANISFRRSVYEKLKGFDELLGPGVPLKGAEDQDFVYSALKGGTRVLACRHIKVSHHMYRINNWEDIISALRDSEMSLGAMFGKHLRCFDLASLLLLLAEWIGRIRQFSKFLLFNKNLPVKKSRALLLIQAWIMPLGWLLLGVLKSFKYKIDRTTCLFIPEN